MGNPMVLRYSSHHSFPGKPSEKSVEKPKVNSESSFPSEIPKFEVKHGSTIIAGWWLTYPSEK